LYFAAVMAAGLLLAGRQRDASDYFLGHRGLPWWALMMSVVATETSALTVISIPGIAARGDLTWLQVTFGYLVGRIGVAYFLLPGYFDGSQDTAYQRLERRFGVAARRTASGVFLFTRSIADGVRMFATAITLAIITHWSMSLGILAIGLVTNLKKIQYANKQLAEVREKIERYNADLKMTAAEAEIARIAGDLNFDELFVGVLDF